MRRINSHLNLSRLAIKIDKDEYNKAMKEKDSLVHKSDQRKRKLVDHVIHETAVKSVHNSAYYKCDLDEL